MMILKRGIERSSISATQHSLYNYLRKQDAKRLAIREAYKHDMHDTPAQPADGLRVIFPRSHIRKTDDFLRKGLSWHYNGFLVAFDDTVIAVDPGVDFLYRL